MPEPPCLPQNSTRAISSHSQHESLVPGTNGCVLRAERGLWEPHSLFLDWDPVLFLLDISHGLPTPSWPCLGHTEDQPHNLTLTSQVSKGRGWGARHAWIETPALTLLTCPGQVNDSKPRLPCKLGKLFKQLYFSSFPHKSENDTNLLEL